jgi:two-component system phosphate regulon sensor histidine kinase PhoR
MVRLNRQPTSLTSIVKQVLEVARTQAMLKSIKLIEQVAPEHLRVEADHDMMHQAVLNLVSNAIKYTPDGGTVKISVAADQRRGVVVCDVSDTGIGIPPEDLPCIFDKFHRVQADSKLASGTGLGLALTKHIIETLHGGKLSVTSERGKGSTFGFELRIMA